MAEVNAGTPMEIYTLELTYDELLALQDVTDRLSSGTTVTATSVFMTPAFRSANEKIMELWGEARPDES